MFCFSHQPLTLLFSPSLPFLSKFMETLFSIPQIQDNLPILKLSGQQLEFHLNLNSPVPYFIIYSWIQRIRAWVCLGNSHSESIHLDLPSSNFEHNGWGNWNVGRERNNLWVTKSGRFYDYHQLNMVLNRKYKWFVLAYKIPWSFFFLNFCLSFFLVFPFLIKVECRIHKNDYMGVPVHWNFILLCLKKENILKTSGSKTSFQFKA